MFSQVEVRTLCSLVKFFYTKHAHSWLNRLSCYNTASQPCCNSKGPSPNCRLGQHDIKPYEWRMGCQSTSCVCWRYISKYFWQYSVTSFCTLWYWGEKGKIKFCFRAGLSWHCSSREGSKHHRQPKRSIKPSQWDFTGTAPFHWLQQLWREQRRSWDEDTE